MIEHQEAMDRIFSKPPYKNNIICQTFDNLHTFVDANMAKIDNDLQNYMAK